MAPPAGYGQRPQQPSQDPYQITHYAAQYGNPAAQPQPYQQAAYPAAPIASRKSPVLGMIGFGIVMVALVVTALAAQPVGEVLASVILASGSSQIDQSTLTQIISEQVPLQTLMLNVGSTVGFAGWVVGIVAAITGRGRMWGVFAIIVGILAPFIMGGVMLATMWPALAAVAR